MEAGVLVLLATMEWGVRTGAYGLFLAVGAVGNLVGSLLHQRPRQAFRQRPDSHRHRNCIRRRIPDHGLGALVAFGRSWLLSRRLCRRGRIRRSNLAPPEVDSAEPHGASGKCVARHCLGCSARRRTCSGNSGVGRGTSTPACAGGDPAMRSRDPARSPPSQEHPSRRGRPQPRCGASREARGRSLPQCGGGLRLSTGRQSAVRQPSGRPGTAVPSDCRATALLLTGIERGGPKRGSEQG